MSSANLIVFVLVLALILRRQLQPKAIREDRSQILMAVVAAIGVVETVQYAQDHHVSTTAWVALCVSLIVGLGFGALRGSLVHIWRQDGVLFRQGNAITVVLWTVGIAIHLGIDLLAGGSGKNAGQFTSSSLLLYLGLSLAAQRYVTLRRADASRLAQHFSD